MKKTIKTTIRTTILTLLVLTLALSTAFLTYLHFFASGNKNVSGEWIADLDMTEHAAAAALNWLQDIEGVSVSQEDMEACMQGLSVRVDLILEQTARSEGTFRCGVLPESYDACNEAAYEAFAEAFRGLLTERLVMAGYTGSTDEEALEALVTETFGMSTVSYLMTYGPALLPALEDLQAWYDGGGVYETEEGVLIRQFDEGWSVENRAEYYTRTDTGLILFAEADSGKRASEHYPIRYTLQQTQDQ